MPDLFPASQKQVSLQRQIKCAEREIKQRQRVYPRLISSDRMAEDFAHEEIAVMEQVLVTLQGQLK